jgi:hypothetical protein
MDDDVPGVMKIDLIPLLDQLGELNGADTRAVFAVIRQILLIAEQPSLSDAENSTLLDYAHVILKIAKETTSTVVTNGCLKILAAMTRRGANARRLCAAGVHHYLKLLVSGKEPALRCKALRCVADLCRSDEGAAAVQTASMAPALLFCTKSFSGPKGAEARLHALNALANLLVASPDALEVAAQTSGISALVSALDPESSPTFCAAARCLSILCRRDKAIRAEVARSGSARPPARRRLICYVTACCLLAYSGRLLGYICTIIRPVVSFRRPLPGRKETSSA